ncbi:hypothetical protein DFH06DRAFT_1330521 [Mycena polygramma]|nr:hypothetical protein DFH06DRAFT_1330521 [Mycena polygramma]
MARAQAAKLANAKASTTLRRAAPQYAPRRAFDLSGTCHSPMGMARSTPTSRRSTTSTPSLQATEDVQKTHVCGTRAGLGPVAPSSSASASLHYPRSLHFVSATLIFPSYTPPSSFLHVSRFTPSSFTPSPIFDSCQPPLILTIPLAPSPRRLTRGGVSASLPFRYPFTHPFPFAYQYIHTLLVYCALGVSRPPSTLSLTPSFLLSYPALCRGPVRAPLALAAVRASGNVRFLFFLPSFFMRSSFILCAP